MAKEMLLAKRRFTMAQADAYGDVSDDNPDLPFWIVTFPDDAPPRKGRGRAWGRLTA